MGEDAAAPIDPASLIRSGRYRVLLVFAALIGVLVSLASWGFLELVRSIQVGVYTDLPGDVGYDTAPWWWPLPWLALAGVLTAFAIERLPGHGGHVPADGLKTGGGPTRPIELPGVLLAAHLPGFSETPAVAVLMGAGVVSVLRLPLSSVVIALLLTSKAGLSVAPLIIVAVTAAYITTAVLSARRVEAPPPGGARVYEQG